MTLGTCPCVGCGLWQHPWPPPTTGWWLPRPGCDHQKCLQSLPRVPQMAKSHPLGRMPLTSQAPTSNAYSIPFPRQRFPPFLKCPWEQQATAAGFSPTWFSNPGVGAAMPRSPFLAHSVRPAVLISPSGPVTTSSLTLAGTTGPSLPQLPLSPCSSLAHLAPPAAP